MDPSWDWLVNVGSWWPQLVEKKLPGAPNGG